MLAILPKISIAMCSHLRKKKLAMYIAILFLLFGSKTDEKLSNGQSKTSFNSDKQQTKFETLNINFMPETPKECNQQELSASTISESITITSDVIIPTYEPLDVPYSQWEIHRSRELLEANGFGNSISDWRRATQNSDGLIRSTALYLLTRNPEKKDEYLFHQGIKDIDETVQILSAYGLYRLGDHSVISTIRKIAQLDVQAHSAAIQAAGMLAQLGDPTAFPTIEQALNSQLEYLRLLAIQNLMFFVPLQGQTYLSGKVVDVWSYYHQALNDKSNQVQSVAKLQLQELGTSEALELLQNSEK